MFHVIGELLVFAFVALALVILSGNYPGLAMWIGRLLIALGVLNYFILRTRYEKLRKKLAKVIKYEKMRSKLAVSPKP